MIGGKVLDASALAALVRGHLRAAAWIPNPRQRGIPLHLPPLALTEARAVLPEPAPPRAAPLRRPSAMLSDLDLARPPAVATPLDTADASAQLHRHRRPP
ncbi:hypothetical protein D8M34_18155, partial [Microbacterium sp. HSID17254]|uniref:hypothetical protein n=1 Tax=Microbacterium sp. HSID17254 TaxID=2419509 RepID=UPI000F883A1C